MMNIKIVYKQTAGGEKEIATFEGVMSFKDCLQELYSNNESIQILWKECRIETLLSCATEGKDVCSISVSGICVDEDFIGEKICGPDLQYIPFVTTLKSNYEDRAHLEALLKQLNQKWITTGISSLEITKGAC